MTARLAFLALIALAGLHTPAQAAPLPIVAAENVYGDVAAQIGGPDVAVISILSNPDQDPHLFEASPSVGRAVAAARIVIYNGLDYDPWMARLLGAAAGAHRQTIAVAARAHHRPGDNPHIWYDTATMRAVGQAIATELAAIDPEHKTDYAARLASFTHQIAAIDARIAALRPRLAGLPVTATEPVFGYMFQALGMQVRNMPFQIAVMNDTEPSASQIGAFERDLRTHQVRLLLYNSQATDTTADRMKAIALAAGVPILGATETEPPGLSYQAWMTGALAALSAALPPAK